MGNIPGITEGVWMNIPRLGYVFSFVSPRARILRRMEFKIRTRSLEGIDQSGRRNFAHPDSPEYFPIRSRVVAWKFSFLNTCGSLGFLGFLGNSCVRSYDRFYASTVTNSHNDKKNLCSCKIVNFFFNFRYLHCFRSLERWDSRGL